MKKIYLKPEIELTECVMLRAAVCSGGVSTDNNNQPNIPSTNPPAPGQGAPGRVF